MNKSIKSLLMLLSVLMSINRNGCGYFCTNISLKINHSPLSPQAPPCLPSAKGNTSLVPVARRGSKKISDIRVTGLCEGNPRWPVDSLLKGPITWKLFPFADIIMFLTSLVGGGRIPGRWWTTFPRSISTHLLILITHLLAIDWPFTYWNILRKHNKYSCIS